MVDALIALADPSPESVGSILGATLTQGRLSEVFDCVFAQGSFRKVQLRYYKEVSAGILNLDARLDSGLTATTMDLRKYGPPTSRGISSPTHLGGSEGYYTLGFTLARGVKIYFQFTNQTERLYGVGIDWDANRSK